MSKEKIIIISSNLESSNEEIKSLFAKSNFHCIFESQDGEELCKAICKENPDVVLMDIFMPNLDAIGVMDTIKKNSSLSTTPIFIITSNLNSPTIEKELFAHGAGYLFLHPINLKLLVERIVQLTKHNSNMGIQIKYDLLNNSISNILDNINIPRHIKGYTYLCDSISFAINDPIVLNSIIKALYPAVAEKNHTTASRVERAIRHSIEIVWDRGEKAYLEQYLGYSPEGDYGRPTNSEFINALYNVVRNN